VYILTQADQGKSLTVGISGAVHLPQTVAYAEGLSLGELLQMAGGVKLDADLSRVEVSRVVTNPNLPQRAELFSFNLPDAAASDLEAATEAFSFVLKPFDQVVVRAKPNYSMQKLVYVGGEVKYPGYYALSTYDERLSSLVSRAGGSTKFGDLSNAQLYRNEAPNVVVDLKTAVSAPSSKANFVLAKGDSVVVPEVNNLVMIYGTGHQSFSITGTDTLNAPYVGRLRADRYIKDFALGFAKRADRSTVYVNYPNGKFSRTKTYPFMRVYPVVKQGATISVVNKPLKVKRTTQINLDLNQVIATMVSAATGFATVYVLLTR
jgi:protein involved in polysaccharide export with SLBB domain